MDRYAALIEEASLQLATSILEMEPEPVAAAADVDTVVQRLQRCIGQRTVQRLYDALSERVIADAVAAGFCMHRAVTICFTTLYGATRVFSPYLRGPTGGARPVKDRLGLVGRQKSRAVERALTDFGVEEAFGQAAERFEEHYGFRVQPDAIRRVVLRRGQEAVRFVDTALDAVADEQVSPDVLFIGLDGCNVRTAVLVEQGEQRTAVRGLPKKRRVENWREVRLGLASVHDEDDDRQLFVAKMGTYPELLSDLRRAAEQLGVEHAEKVVSVVDGGNGLREAICRTFPEVQLVLDWPHCRSQLHETASEMGLVDPALSERVDTWMKMLQVGRVDALRLLLQNHRGPGADRALKLDKHLERFADAVHYEHFRELGLPIGSGRVESAHRYVTQKRMKKPGAWWREDTVNPMLALRLLRPNRWWSGFWEQAA
jgi:hypothetical protein